MSKNYDRIATVNIDIESPIVDDTSFDNLLIVGPPPKKKPSKDPAKVGVYASIDEVIAAGFATSGEEADPIGVAAMVAFGQSPTPTAVYIAPQQLQPEQEFGGEVEDVIDTIRRAMGVSGWYVLCTAGIDSEKYDEIAAYIETQEKMFVYTETDYFEQASPEERKAVVANTYFRTAGIFAKETSDQEAEAIPEYNQYAHVAFAAKWLSYESGSETTAFKTLSMIAPSELTTDEMDALVKANLNYFVTVGSKNVTLNGKTMAGEWADVIRFRDWLKNDMQVRVVNVFMQNAKVTFNDGGIGLVQNAMLESLRAGQNVGGIADDEFDADGGTIPGFEVRVPSAVDLSAEDRASRKLAGLKFRARIASAIHFADVTGSLTYTL